MSDTIKTEPNVHPVAASPSSGSSEVSTSSATKRGRKLKAKSVEAAESDQLESGDDEQKPRKRKKERNLWTAAEEALLLDGVKRGLTWTQISREVMPHRCASSCRIHYLVLTKHLNGEWSNDEHEKLNRARKRCTKLWSDYWDAVAKEMNGPRGRDECIKKYEESLKK
ncbi:hypothetical protein BC937DRAFT_90804 [Endogone sp. FLAS-F59071]|nr:hypothetical protein BC937DRAFT_90804 [Endogone sp. FLAS-F59071]|eukprot:RUS16795.1 hypothetical protein BC937DRAFT_90804 [Endogone sp. FLAS-F59071]